MFQGLQDKDGEFQLLSYCILAPNSPFHMLFCEAGAGTLETITIDFFFSINE